MGLGALNIYHLHDRHPGITEGIGLAGSDAAEVCLYRHHDMSPIAWEVQLPGELTTSMCDWFAPSDRTQAANANQDDATESAAYCVSAAIVEEQLGLVVFHRAKTRTGADWWVMPLAAVTDPPTYGLDQEKASRLEVSGVDDDNPTKMRTRMTEKIAQLRAVDLGPGIASVVGFASPVARIQYS